MASTTKVKGYAKISKTGKVITVKAHDRKNSYDSNTIFDRSDKNTHFLLKNY